MIVIGISEDGYPRDPLSIDIGNSDNETDWSHIFKTLKERGLKGVQSVLSDDHKGLVKALQRNFQGSVWQRCQVHFMRNFITKMSRRKAKLYIPLLKDVFAATTKEDAVIRKDRLIDKLESKKPDIAR
jgi:putative transposase